ncbi:unnamed protein product [Effrenium voratum]|uniref:Uncharacterized protein n=1 Tax=Effrenium voratum TaxID=2562239 RepID=A0AA36I560_9DINO|nr:unnamed protein product [Effrenium voratum]CAJ1427124.1 unnamed protein product [Effrenium voratum]
MVYLRQLMPTRGFLLGFWRKGPPGRRWIHARPEHTSQQLQQKLLTRPREDLLSPGRTGRLGRSQSNFIPAPTQEPGPKATAAVRKQLQLSKYPQDLLQHLERAAAEGKLDPTVIGAAMKRCEQGRFWDALLRARSLQKKEKILLGPVQVSIYLTALARCASGERGSVQEARRRQVFALAREAFDGSAFDGWDSVTGSIVLNSALHACSISADPDAARWAKDLWETAARHGVQHSNSNYSSLATLWEKLGAADAVDELLALAAQGPPRWRPSHVTLAALVDAAGERRDWKRAEALWSRLVRLGVAPQLAAAARAKAHLLCGRVHACTQLAAGEGAGGYKLAELEVQALLVAYHSAPEPAMEERLRAALRNGEDCLKRESSHRQLRDWKLLRQAGELLLAGQPQLRLREVLLSYIARRSVMMEWPNHPAATRYLHPEAPEDLDVGIRPET